MMNRENGVSITYIAGTINKNEKQIFEKLVYRASRGRALCHFDESNFTIKDFDGVEKHRVVYVLVFQQVAFLRERVHKTCETFQGKIFSLPDDGASGPASFRRVMKDLKTKI